MTAIGGGRSAGAVVQAPADAKADAIFSSLFSPDLQKFVRESNTQGLFKMKGLKLTLEKQAA